MKKIVLGLMLLCGATAIEAQNEVETTICGDVVSSYTGVVRTWAMYLCSLH